jgi:3-polyprenyl-4-hydroxybenzoate decarboxylase
MLDLDAAVQSCSATHRMVLVSSCSMRMHVKIQYSILSEMKMRGAEQVVLSGPLNFQLHT